MIAWLAVASVLSPPASAETEPRPVRIVAPFEIKGSDPAVSGDIFLRMDITETLVEADAQGRPVPALASHWQVAPGGKSWTFTLRDNVQFHDGSPLSAESVVKSLQIARSKPGLLDKAPITDIQPQGNTVIIHLSRPFAPLLTFLAESRSQILALSAWNAAGQVSKVIGTGPFELTRFQPPQQLEVKRFAHYWGPQPAITAARYLSAGRAETRAVLAESGDADYVFNLDPASRARLAQRPQLKLLSVSVPRTVLLKLNAAHPALQQVEARQAISLAIQRDALARAVLRYPASATQMFPPSVPDWHNPQLPALAWQPAEAKKKLAALGWTAGADGILTREGQRFALTLTTYPDRPELPLIAMVIQQQLRSIGIDVTLNSTNSSEIPLKHHNNTLDMALFARNFALTPDPLGTLMQDYPATGGDWGAMNWHNAAFTAALDKLTQPDVQDANALRQQVTAILQAELPVIPVAWYQQTVAVARGLQIPGVDPFERHFGLREMQWEAK